MSKLVRLKPRDLKKGHIIRRYTAFSQTFDEMRGWYLVSDDVAAYLATVRQVPNDEDKPLAFDVCTEAEAKRLDDAERRKSEERARAAEPNTAAPEQSPPTKGDLSTADLPDPRRRQPATPAARR